MFPQIFLILLRRVSLGAKWSPGIKDILESYPGILMKHEDGREGLQIHENQEIQASIGLLKPETAQRWSTYFLFAWSN